MKNVILLKLPSTSKTIVQAKPPVTQTSLIVIDTVLQIISVLTIPIVKSKISVIQPKPIPLLRKY